MPASGIIACAVAPARSAAVTGSTASLLAAGCGRPQHAHSWRLSKLVLLAAEQAGVCHAAQRLHCAGQPGQGRVRLCQALLQHAGRLAVRTQGVWLASLGAGVVCGGLNRLKQAVVCNGSKLPCAVARMPWVLGLASRAACQRVSAPSTPHTPASVPPNPCCNAGAAAGAAQAADVGAAAAAGRRTRRSTGHVQVGPNWDGNGLHLQMAVERANAQAQAVHVATVLAATAYVLPGVLTRHAVLTVPAGGRWMSCGP